LSDIVFNPDRNTTTGTGCKLQKTKVEFYSSETWLETHNVEDQLALDYVDTGMDMDNYFTVAAVTG
jgi:hypothetical protein